MKQRTMPAALRWAARWRAAARIARRDAARHRGRTVLVAALVALPLIAGSAGLVLLRSTEPSDAAIVRDALGSMVQARITLECGGAYLPNPDPNGRRCYGDAVPVPRSDAEMDAAFTDALPAGSTVIPVRIAQVDYLAGEKSQLSRPYAEIDLTEQVTLGGLDEGRVPEHPSEILVSGHMARSALLHVGDRIVLRPATHGVASATRQVELVVVGIGRVGAGVPADFVGVPGSLVDPFEDGAEPSTWYVTGDAPVLAEHAELLYPLGLEVLTKDIIVREPSHLPVTGSMVRAASMIPGVIWRADTAVVAIVALLILLEAVLLIGPAFVVGARRETRNLALVAATGGEPADLRRIVLATGLVVGGGAAATGTVIGAALGAALVPALRTQDIYVPDVALPVAELLALALGGTAIAVAAAWLPARQAARTDVVAALSGRRPAASPHRRKPLVGLACLVLGIIAAFGGALAGWTVLQLLGILALQLGIIGTAGSVVGRLAQAAHRTGPAVRYALRDADRHRARTAPALAAIIAATAVAAAGLTFQGSQDAHDLLLQQPDAAAGTLVAGVYPTSSETSAETSSLPWSTSVTTYGVLLSEALDGAPLVEARSPVPLNIDRSAQITLVRPAGQACPADQQDSDPRCGGTSSASNVFSTPDGHDPVLQDDGSTVRALGLPDAETIAGALATNHAVVASARDLWTEADGSTSAHLSVPGRDDPVIVPAVAHTWGEWRHPLILPPSVVDQIGWRSAPIGFVVPASAGVTSQQAGGLWKLDVVGVNALVTLTTAPLTPPRGPLVAAIAAAALLSVLATWIVVGLAASESRPDLATISAVGASPRTRRALAGAQAGVLSVVGTALGIAAGVVFGAVLVLAQRVRAGGTGWMWQLDLPWQLLGLLACTAPLLAIGGAALATRSRLPLTRRLAS